MCWRLGAASIFLAIYITINFRHLLKIAFLGRAKSTQTCCVMCLVVLCLWSPHKRCVCISLTWSDQNASQRPPGISHQTQQMVAKFCLAPSCSVGSPAGRALAPWRRVARALSPGRRKADLLTHEHIFHPKEAPRADWTAATILGFSRWRCSAPHEFPQVVVALFVGRGSRGERPAQTDCELGYRNVPKVIPTRRARALSEEVSHRVFWKEKSSLTPGEAPELPHILTFDNDGGVLL